MGMHFGLVDCLEGMFGATSEQQLAKDEPRSSQVALFQVRRGEPQDLLNSISRIDNFEESFPGGPNTFRHSRRIFA
jgi:hypothetical protein